MLLLQALGAEDTYLADVVAVDEGRNAVTCWHCGLAPGRLAADPSDPRQDVHCNRGIAVVGDFPLRPGRVTVARIGSSSSYRLYVTGGEAVRGPNRFKGNSVDVVLDRDAGNAVRTFVERGFEHHTVLAWGDLRPQLRRAASLLDLELVEC
jgi:L-fucose isomerase-like protein